MRVPGPRNLSIVVGVLLLLVASGLANAATTGFERAQVPSPSPSTMSAISCSSASWCFALGEYPNRRRSSSLVLADRWDGRSWRQVHPPSPRNPTVLGASCASRRSCVMVGIQSAPGGNNPFAERWGGRSWHVLRMPSLPGHDNFLYAVSCPSASNCVAVGTTQAQTSAQAALVERWNGRRWTAARVPGSSKGVLRAVSCVTAGDCWAVGITAVSSSSTSPLIIHVGATGASVVGSPRGAGMLGSVSCPTASSCWAVGNGRAPSLIGLQDGAWHAFPSSDRYGQILGISCVTATDCTAVGIGLGRPWAGAWDGSGWEDLPTPAVGGTFQSVACTGNRACYAAGFTGNGLGRALVATSQTG